MVSESTFFRCFADDLNRIEPGGGGGNARCIWNRSDRWQRKGEFRDKMLLASLIQPRTPVYRSPARPPRSQSNPRSPYQDRGYKGRWFLPIPHDKHDYSLVSLGKRPDITVLIGNLKCHRRYLTQSLAIPANPAVHLLSMRARVNRNG